MHSMGWLSSPDSTNSYIRALTSNALGDRDLKNKLRLKRDIKAGPWPNRTDAFHKEEKNQQCVDTERQHAMPQQEGKPPVTRKSHKQGRLLTLDLYTSSFRTLRKEFMLFKLPSLWILLWYLRPTPLLGDLSECLSPPWSLSCFLLCCSYATGWICSSSFFNVSSWSNKASSSWQQYSEECSDSWTILHVSKS